MRASTPAGHHNRRTTAPHRFRRAFVGATFLAASSTWAAGSASIFDNDWQPPARVEPPTSLPSTLPSAGSATRAAGGASSPAAPAAPPVAADTSVAPPPLRPIPAEPERQRSRKLMRELYAKALADPSPAGRDALARLLLADAPRVADKPSDLYVLLAGAVEAAGEAGDLPLCAAAADRLADGFDVDAPAVKADAIARARPAAADAAAAAGENVRVGLAVVDQLVAEDDLPAAAKVCAALLTLAGGDPGRRAAVQQASRDVAALRAERDRLVRSVDRLRAAPADPAANQVVGSYLCFKRLDWAAGLPLLAAGEDATLRAAAAADLASPKSADALAAAADAWWAAADRQPAGPAQQQMRLRAVAWYRAALADGRFRGLDRVRMEKRIEAAPDEATRPPAGRTAAAARPDPKRWLPTPGEWVRRWTVKGGNLSADLRLQTYSIYARGTRVKAFTWDLAFVREPDGSLSIEGSHFFQTFTPTESGVGVREWKTRADYRAGKDPQFVGTFEPAPR